MPEHANGTVIVGTLGTSPLIDGLVKAGKLDVAGLKGQWEGYVEQVVDDPAPGVPRALVIAGSDRRGAVFGTYDISQKIGVSPWHWWADVPVPHRDTLYLTAGARRDQPKVRYRGFFINDEDPAFSGWAKKRFGGVNSAAYAQVFELLLRLKGNYLWPAMWGKAFAVDDPQDQALANAMGVVMGTSHHEPMTRAQQEWHIPDGKGVTGGPWDYTRNAKNLRTFWRGGIERMVSACGKTPCENLVTVGMRGDGDEPMSEGTAIPLLEKVVADQRKIIADVTRKPASETPQVWALYKEVQDYYDHGMKVPDDVTLLFSDDNWGQLRRLPPEGAPPRKGGYGIYYHFDYVGGPRSYRWIDENQVAKVWQQMDLAWQRGARQLWIVNVGDLKPMEYPLSFFMAQAWDPEAMNAQAMAGWTEKWAAENLGEAQAKDIAQLLSYSSTLASWRKPELIDDKTFPLGEGTPERLDGGEFGQVVAMWRAVAGIARQQDQMLPPAYHDAFYELVEHRILALSNLCEMYYAQAWNKRLAAANDPRANYFAALVEADFAKDKAITGAYHALAGGKWDGMMAQSHIGYTTWAAPDADVLPEVSRVPSNLSAKEIAAKIAFAQPQRFSESDFSLEPEAAARNRDNGKVRWTIVPDLGRTFNAAVSLPQDAPPTTQADGVRLEYDLALKGGETKVALFLVPTLGTDAGGKLRVGLSLDDGPVQVLTSSLEPTAGASTTQDQRDWEKAVEDNAHVLTADFGTIAAGKHVLKLWRLDGNVVVQRIGIGADPAGGRYLGPLPQAAPDAPAAQ
jgi:hypothetical protein